MRRSSYSLPGRSLRRRRVAIAQNCEPDFVQEKQEVPETCDTKPNPPSAVEKPVVPPESSQPEASPTFNPETPSPSALFKRLQNSEPMTWIFAGDSNFCSVASSSETFPRLVADWTKTKFGRTNEIFVNATYSHARLEHVKERMKIRFARFAPDVVTLICGFADCEHGVEQCEEFEKSLIEIIKNIQDTGAIPVICTPPYSEYEEESQEQFDQLIFLEAIRSCTAEYNGILIDHWEHWEQHLQPNSQPDFLWNRDLHQPTMAGILEMQKLFLKELGIDRTKILATQEKVPQHQDSTT